jgi:hypothetical protein
MNNIRAKFEEIWPVPEGVQWGEYSGRYVAVNRFYISTELEYQARLDTFTRCQETTSIHLSLIDELVQSLQWYVDEDEIHEGDPENKYWVDGKHEAEELLDRAKQITGAKE